MASLEAAVTGGLTWYGRLCALGLLLCAVVVLVVGILLIVNNNTCSQFVTATVAPACGLTSCCLQDPPGSGNYTCNLLLNYTINGVAYTDVPLQTHGGLYSSGSTVDVCYSSADAKQISLKQVNTSGAGIAMTVVGSVAILGLSLLNYKVWTNDQTAATFGSYEALSRVLS